MPTSSAAAAAAAHGHEWVHDASLKEKALCPGKTKATVLAHHETTALMQCLGHFLLQ
jgi:hypothetical protein